MVVELTVKVEVAVPPLDTLRLVGLSEAVSPVGETLAERETVPEKPYRLVTVTVEVLAMPDFAAGLAGLVDTLKLGGFGGLSRPNLMLIGAEVPWP